MLLRAGGRPVTEAGIESISPWRFRAPLSPDMAARREGRAIAFDELVSYCRERVKSRNDERVLIEGVGGVCVPLDDTYTVLDWMEACALPVLLVAGSYLGTLSHTLTAASALEQRGIRLRGVILSESPESPVSLEESRATLRNFLAPELPVVILPRLAGEPLWAQAPPLLDEIGL